MSKYSTDRSIMLWLAGLLFGAAGHRRGLRQPLAISFEPEAQAPAGSAISAVMDLPFVSGLSSKAVTVTQAPMMMP
jgi:hypothetical protein